MGKERTNRFQSAVTALIAAVFFFVATHRFFLHLWHCDLIRAKHWRHIWNKWQNGWVIQTPKELAFFGALLLIVPLYFAVLRLFRALLNAPVVWWKQKKQEHLLEKSIAAAKGPEDKTPKSKKEAQKVIKMTSNEFKHIEQLRGKKSPVQHAIEAHGDTPDSAASTRAVAPNVSPAATRFDLWEALAKQFEAKHIFVLRRMKIGSHSVNTIAITREGLFLLFEPPETGTVWTPDENAVPPVWRSEAGVVPSPLSEMIQSRDALREYFARNMPQMTDIPVYCCMIFDYGELKNVSDLMPILESQDISVLRMGDAFKTQSLPDSGALIEYIKSLPPSSQETNDAVAVAILDLMETEDTV